MRVRVDEKYSFLFRYKRHSRSDANKKQKKNGKVFLVSGELQIKRFSFFFFSFLQEISLNFCQGSQVSV